MSRVVAVHSFRGGTGKSNTTANVAVMAARRGLRVGVVDTDIQSPGIHVLFGIDQATIGRTLNDHLWGRCAITEAAVDVTAGLDPTLEGRVFLVPSSIDAGDIARVMHDGYDVALLHEGIRTLVDELRLDLLLLDTHPGLNEETLLSIAVSDTVVVVLRPDQQDYEGTSVTVSVARRLQVPHMLLVVNKTPAVFDHADVEERVRAAYDCEVAAVLPHSDDLMAYSSQGVFSLSRPDHPVAAMYDALAARIVG
ncbi:MinD/ParA family ATP-binding protein [Patulibacter minatonensis]|uniref:MinD/ParA family ATP-binding protein n=1 Tax=Patulibacter minatonensis TaxID=298163 RepID=UPI000478DD44|nr:MinD/ParA family protein [Patulibacter minatonensis]